MQSSEPQTQSLFSSEKLNLPKGPHPLRYPWQAVSGPGRCSGESHSVTYKSWLHS